MALQHDDYLRLVKKLHALNADYYTKNESELADADYDSLYQQLKAFEAQYPLLVSPDSPTQQVGAGPEEHFAHHVHHPKMLSLANAFNADDLARFLNRVNKDAQDAQGGQVHLSIEPKVDGCAVSIDYKNGTLAVAATRGNGHIGEIITDNIRTIVGLPHTIPVQHNVTVRGEVYIKKSVFNHIKSDFANARNAASGALRQLDANVTKDRQLDILIYGAAIGGHESHVDTIDWLKSMGFPVVDAQKVPALLPPLQNAIGAIDHSRSERDYDIDGVVIKVDHEPLQLVMGATAKAPRWAVAYKFAEEEGVTTLEDVSFQVGRTGIITPVAQLAPVTLSGVTIKRATLHNSDEIKRLDIHIGDKVRLKRAGEVIPKIIGVAEPGDDRRSILVPNQCPSCMQASVVPVDSGVAIQCINPQCPAQIKARIRHFCSKNAMDIAGLGDAIIEQLLASKCIDTVADLYALRYEDLIALDRFADKSAQNLIDAIHASKTRPLSRLLIALGIPHIGDVSADLLAARFPSLDALLTAKEEDLLILDQVGPKMARAIMALQSSVHFKQLIDALLLNGVQPTTSRVQNQPLQGQTYAISGTLSQPRSAIQAMIKANGGRVVANVGKKTNGLIYGDSPGSKYAKALALKDKGTPIALLNESEFMALLNESSQ